MVSLTVMVASFLATNDLVIFSKNKDVSKCIERAELHPSGTARIWAEGNRPPVLILAVCF
jgi:hypothetical protein